LITKKSNLVFELGLSAFPLAGALLELSKLLLGLISVALGLLVGAGKVGLVLLEVGNRGAELVGGVLGLADEEFGLVGTLDLAFDVLLDLTGTVLGLETVLEGSLELVVTIVEGLLETGDLRLDRVDLGLELRAGTFGVVSARGRALQLLVEVTDLGLKRGDLLGLSSKLLLGGSELSADADGLLLGLETLGLRGLEEGLGGRGSLSSLLGLLLKGTDLAGDALEVALGIVEVDSETLGLLVSVLGARRAVWREDWREAISPWILRLCSSSRRLASRASLRSRRTRSRSFLIESRSRRMASRSSSASSIWARASSRSCSMRRVLRMATSRARCSSSRSARRFWASDSKARFSRSRAALTSFSWSS
jgi:hypothetical protein